jgi:calcineurin-like phosphoesterase family protein
MIFFTADLHFGHEAILRYCARPFSDVSTMNSALIENWNKAIRPTDTVYVVGDLAFCHYREFAEIAKVLNGKKILIKGNHDSYSEGQYLKLGFQVFHEIKMKLCGKMVRISHYPYAPTWWRRPFCYKSELRYLDKRPPVVKGEWLIHGHTHTKHRGFERRIHVGVDAWSYGPVALSEIESLIGKRL